VTFVLLIGGARSGKSALAVELALQSDRDVVFVATAEERDDEMRARIACHRAQRPMRWETVEAPLDLTEALAAAAPERCVVVDCLSLWVANMLEAGRSQPEIEERASATAAAAARRLAPLIVVTNEVGLGVVPATPLGRRYRDLLGRVNGIWAEAADEALLVVAGRVLPLAPPIGLGTLAVTAEAVGDRD
jgi:adenosyl cobinamide kinase/adenosyl cobinamide phosphate guanylyltransferase